VGEGYSLTTLAFPHWEHIKTGRFEILAADFFGRYAQPPDPLKACSSDV